MVEWCVGSVRGVTNDHIEGVQRASLQNIQFDAPAAIDRHGHRVLGAQKTDWSARLRNSGFLKHLPHRLR
jgi:hypothetical protein